MVSRELQEVLLLARTITDLQSVPVTDTWFVAVFGSGRLGPVPVLVIWSAAALALGHFVYRETRFGAHVLAIGDSQSAARVAGIKVDRTRIAVLVLMGAISGLAGAIFLGFRGAIDPTTGDTYLLPVVAAVIIGGTALSGGRGTILGAVLGALIIQTIQSGILFLGIDAKWSIFVTGAVIIVAVAVDQIVRRQRTRRARDTVDAG